MVGFELGFGFGWLVWVWVWLVGLELGFGFGLDCACLHPCPGTRDPIQIWAHSRKAETTIAWQPKTPAKPRVIHWASCLKLALPALPRWLTVEIDKSHRGAMLGMTSYACQAELPSGTHTHTHAHVIMHAVQDSKSHALCTREPAACLQRQWLVKNLHQQMKLKPHHVCISHKQPRNHLNGTFCSINMASKLGLQRASLARKSIKGRLRELALQILDLRFLVAW